MIKNLILLIGKTKNPLNRNSILAASAFRSIA